MNASRASPLGGPPPKAMLEWLINYPGELLFLSRKDAYGIIKIIFHEVCFASLGLCESLFSIPSTVCLYRDAANIFCQTHAKKFKFKFKFAE